MKRLVIILGMHRSGTSVTARIGQCMGAYLGEAGELMNASAENLDGYFENVEVVRINDNILQACNKEWYDLETANPDYNSLRIIKAMEEIKEVIQRLLEKNDTVVIKDPRISVLLMLWGKVLTDLGVKVDYIWVYRNPLEVMESLRKRDGYSSGHSLLLWIHYNLSILKYLQGKEYLLVNYRDILEQPETIEELGRFFNYKIDDGFKRELGHIVKRGYCHSDYSYQDVINTRNELLTDLYGALLQNREEKTCVSEWEECYKATIVKDDNRFMDYDTLENIRCLEGKEIVIYGAGKCGQQAANMLQQLGFSKYNFCDKDIHKQGINLMNGKVFSITEINNMENLLIIIAIENNKVRKAIEQTLLYLEKVSFISFFTLKTIWTFFTKDYTRMKDKTEAFSLWYRRLEARGNSIKAACEYPVLVYQNGKVGSSTVSRSLWDAGIENAHIHRFFFKKDIVGELILGEEQIKFIKKSNYFSFQYPEYIKTIKDEIKGKKIITMVREPIAVDLSTVFQWIGSGTANWYFAEQMRRGKTFGQIVSELMVKIQNRLFEWFDEELKELCGIDVLKYSFDIERGYTIISKNGMEVLLIKTENLSQSEEIIGGFVGNYQFKLINDNIGEDKEYSHLYREIKKKIELPKEYVEHYYTNNSYMDHFYSKEEQKYFFNKWRRCIQDND